MMYIRSNNDLTKLLHYINFTPEKIERTAHILLKRARIAKTRQILGVKDFPGRQIAMALQR